jgi:hypothetical protein
MGGGGGGEFGQTTCSQFLGSVSQKHFIQYCITVFIYVVHLYCTAQSRQSAKLFLQSSDWDSPNPSPADEFAPPRFWGEGHTRWRERGSDERTYTVALFIYTYFVLYSVL